MHVMQAVQLWLIDFSHKITQARLPGAFLDFKVYIVFRDQASDD